MQMKMKTAKPIRNLKNNIVKKNIDEVLNETGLSSPRQILIQLTLIAFYLFNVYHVVLSFFTGTVPSWKCYEANSSTFCHHHFNRTIKQCDSTFPERCRLSRSEWNYTTVTSYSFVTEFSLDCEKTYLAAIVSSSFFVGGVISAMIIGKISAMYGRKSPLIAFAIVGVVSSVASSYVLNVWHLICLNLLRGAAQVGTEYLIIIYQAEISPPKYRSVLSSILLLAGSTSFLYIDLLAYYVPRWRMISTYATLPCLPFFIGFFFIPKSPRWLYAIGEKGTAMEVLKKLTKSKDVNVEISCKEYMGKSSCTYLDLVRTFKAFTLTSANLFIWFTIPVLYYTIALQAGSFGENMYISFAISTAADIPACIIIIFVCDALGRKKTILGALFICSTLLILIDIIPTSISYRVTLTTITATVARCLSNIAFCAMFTWSNEIFPTVLRSQGMYLCGAIDRTGSVAVPFIIRVLKNWNAKSPFFVVSGMGLLATLAGLSLPETSGKPTRETYQDFLGSEQKIKSSNADVDDIGVDNTCVRTDESELF